MSPVEHGTPNATQDASASSVEQPINLVEGGNTWDTMGRRGIWITTSRQAQKLTPQKTGPDKAELDRIAMFAEAPIRKATKTSWFTVAGSCAFLVMFVVLGVKCTDAYLYRTRIDAGLNALSEGRPAAAQVEFSLAAKSDPKSSDAYYYRALAEVDLGRTKAAFADFKHARELDPTNIKVFLARASLLLKNKFYDLALEDSNKVIALDPSEATAYRLRAAAYAHLGKYQEAITDATSFLNSYTKQDADRADVLAKRAFAYDQLQGFTKAIDDYSEAIACDPHNGSLYVSRAIVHMQLKQWQQGLDDCNEAIAFKPRDPVIFKVRGICYAGLEMDKHALTDLNHLVGLHPTVDTHRIRGDQRFAAGDYVGAMQDAQYVLSAEPEDSDVHSKYLQAKQHLEAHAPRTAVVADAVRHAKMPTSTELQKPADELFRSGYALAQSGDDEPAIEYLAAALKANGRDLYGRRLLAHVLVRNNRHEEALSHFNVLAKIANLETSDKIAWAKSLSASGNQKQAIALYNNVLASDPKNNTARTDLIQLLIANGSRTDAAKLATAGAQACPQMRSHYAQYYDKAVANKQGRRVL